MMTTKPSTLYTDAIRWFSWSEEACRMGDTHCPYTMRFYIASSGPKYILPQEPKTLLTSIVLLSKKSLEVHSLHQ